MSDKSYTALSGDVLAVTDKAVLLGLDDEDEVWIPKSLIEDGDDVEEGEEQDLHVETWFVEQEELD